MPRLEIEVTDKLMEKLQKDADIYGLEPADVAKQIIASSLRKREEPSWLNTVRDIVENLTKIVLVAKKQK